MAKIGTVQWYNARKCYGVIKPIDGGFDVYVSIKAIELAGLSELKEGQRVSFDIVTDDRTGELFAENLSVSLDRQENVITAGQAASPGRRNRWSLRMS